MNNQLSTNRQQSNHSDGGFSLVETQTAMGAIGEQFRLALDIAKTLQFATLIPDHLRMQKIDGKWTPLDPNQVMANVMMVVNRALQWGVDPIALVAESFVVGGKLDFQGKVIIAVVNRLGGLKSNLDFEFEGSGDDLTVIVSGELLKEPGKPREARLAYRDAVTKNSSGKVNEQWTKDVQQKLIYSGAKKWARRHTPEVILGLFSEDDEPASVVQTIEGKTLPRIENAGSTNAQTPGMYDSYLRRIKAVESREELSRLVDRVRTEDPAMVSPEDAEKLVTFCKSRWRHLPSDTAPAVINDSVDPAGSDSTIDPGMDELVLTYEAAIEESQDREAVAKVVALIDKDERLSIAEIKQLGKQANDKVNREFASGVA